MANGFYAARVVIEAGSAEYPLGNTDALRRTRSETVVSKCTQALIDLGCGWVLDTSKNATITDFANIPCRTSAKTYPGLFLVNTISTCKLFISYFGDECVYYGIKDFSGNDLVHIVNNTNYICGLCISMIPEGSTSVFGDPSTSNFIPADATRIYGTVMSPGSYSMYPNAYNPPSGWEDIYIVLATPHVISVGASHYENGSGGIGLPGYATGRIFGTLAHSEDNTLQAKYGTICMRMPNNGLPEGWYFVVRCNQNKNFGLTQDNYCVGINPHDDADIYNYSLCCGAITKADGTWLNGTNNSNKQVVMYVDGSIYSARAFDSTNGATRWAPVAMASVSTDLSTNGVVSGDGFKGYLDTDLFRSGVGVSQQLYDNGNFVYPENDLGYILGWRPTNPMVFG